MPARGMQECRHEQESKRATDVVADVELEQPEQICITAWVSAVTVMKAATNGNVLAKAYC